MAAITRQQLCAELGISESRVRRLEQAGLPFTPIGKRTKRYHLKECRIWLRGVYQPGDHSVEALLQLAGRLVGRHRKSLFAAAALHYGFDEAYALMGRR